MRKTTLRYFFAILLSFSIFQIFGIQYLIGQTVVNNGAFMVVEPGAYVVISDNYINRNDGLTDGKIDLDGTILIGGNWVNTSNNFVVTDIGVSPMGNVIMNGTSVQNIEGTKPTHFDNLTLLNADKSSQSL